jgi:hypothetical protein
MVYIADTGFIVALNSPVKRERDWARGHFERRGSPFYTCEAALAEASHLMEPTAVARMVERGDLLIRFSIFEQITPLVGLLKKYSDRMDMTDACIVRMSELFPTCEVFTVDQTDFSIYRRFGNKPVPAIFPPED